MLKVKNKDTRVTSLIYCTPFCRISIFEFEHVFVYWTVGPVTDFTVFSNILALDAPSCVLQKQVIFMLCFFLTLPVPIPEEEKKKT